MAAQTLGGMSKRGRAAVVACVAAAGWLLGGCAVRPFSEAELASMSRAADETLGGMRAKEGYLADSIDRSIAQAVFPKIGKGAFFVGFGLGSGVLIEDGEVTGTCRKTQVSGGYQIGGAVESEAVLFFSESALSDFKDGDFALASRGVAVIGESGRGYVEEFHGGADEYTSPRVGAMLGVAGALDFYSFRAVE
ncbi:MAG: hypothetical protein AAF108_05230 [Planctomycetota bacterium]